MLGSSPMCWLKFGYKNVNSLYFPNNNIILNFKQLFDKFLKHFFCVFMTGGLTNMLSNVQYTFFHFPLKGGNLFMTERWEQSLFV